MTIVRPTEAQLDYQRRRSFGVFAHFGINTFNGMEWSDGTLSPSTFNPTELDCRQWVDVYKRSGASHVILTAKHHDGFCLWPTATTDYSVASSPWKNGAGDVVGELAAACREAGLGLGLYCSPWDRHQASWKHDHAAYDALYQAQLTELLTNYGELVEVWFDGAGSAEHPYDWDGIMATVRRYQPDAMIFNMGTPTIRWVGNEDGLASDPCWYAVTNTGDFRLDDNRTGRKNGKAYMPPECDVPIRANWFWQDDDVHTLKSLNHLQAIWYRSIGLGANLLLNVPPDNRGLIDSQDAGRLLELGDSMRERLANPSTARLAQRGTTITATFDSDITFDHLVLREDLSEGQRIGPHIIRANSDAIVTNVQTVGSQRVHAFPPVTARSITVEIDDPTGRLAGLEAYCTGVTAIPSLEIQLHHNEGKIVPQEPAGTAS